KAAQGAAPFDMRDMVRGADGAPYVMDSATKSVYRIDLKRKKATNIAKNGRTVGGTRMAVPKLLAMGGRDLLILDTKNALWRWRAAHDAVRGTPTRDTGDGGER